MRQIGVRKRQMLLADLLLEEAGLYRCSPRRRERLWKAALAVLQQVRREASRRVWSYRGTGWQDDIKREVGIA